MSLPDNLLPTDGELPWGAKMRTAWNQMRSILNNTVTALAKRVRVDAPQTFTEAERAQGRANLGVAGGDNVLTSPNGTITSIEEYASVAAIPQPYVPKRIYVVPAP